MGQGPQRFCVNFICLAPGTALAALSQYDDLLRRNLVP
jgi:hypothetical protein